MTDWKNFRNYLVSWVEQKKEYVVHFVEDGDKNYIDSEFNEVIIDGTISYEMQTYILLHECGHILLWENGMALDIQDKSGRTLGASFKERTFTVIEEIEAWKRGLSLAKRLKIPVDEVKWEEEVAEAIGKYIKWAAAPEKYGTEDSPKP